jgi:uncharacterized protein YbcI
MDAAAKREPVNAQHGEMGGERQGLELAELSNAMVRLYKEQFGRGPTKAHSAYAGRDAVLCTLENSFTPAEASLVRMGEHQRLRDTRMFFQYATEKEFRETVEQITGRKVRAFVSGVDVERDVSSELFYLEPSGSGDGQAEDGRAA